MVYWDLRFIFSVQIAKGTELPDQSLKIFYHSMHFIECLYQCFPETGFNELKFQVYFFMTSTYGSAESMAAVLNVFLIAKEAVLINGQTTAIV